MRRILGELAVQVVNPPGGYGDGPAYLRVHHRAGDGWRRRGLGLDIVGHDDEYCYVLAENTHNAFAYREWLCRIGVSAGALTVIRIGG